MVLFPPKFALVQYYATLYLLKGDRGMGQLLVLVINLSNIKYGHVRNLQKNQTFADARKYDLTGDR